MVWCIWHLEWTVDGYSSDSGTAGIANGVVPDPLTSDRECNRLWLLKNSIFKKSGQILRELGYRPARRHRSSRHHPLRSIKWATSLLVFSSPLAVVRAQLRYHNRDGPYHRGRHRPDGWCHLVRSQYPRRTFTRAAQELVEGKGSIFDWAIGWLAREGKVVLTPKKRSFSIRLK